MNKAKKFASVVLAASLIATSSVSLAQWAVIDAGNLVQTTVTAANSILTEVNTYKTMIEQVKSAIELAKSTASVNGLASLAGLQEEYALYTQLKNVDTQLLQYSNQSVQLSQNLKAQYGSSNFSWDAFIASRDSVDSNRNKVMLDQYKTVTSSMEKVAQRRQAIVNSLQNAVGQTSALQQVGAAIDVVIGQNQQVIGMMATANELTRVKQEQHNNDARQISDMDKEYQRKLSEAAKKF